VQPEFLGAGFILASIMPKARTAQIVGIVMIYPMLSLCGAGYQREFLPETTQKFSNFQFFNLCSEPTGGLWIGEV
jgi:hypothetical protein